MPIFCCLDLCNPFTLDILCLLWLLSLLFLLYLLHADSKYDLPNAVDIYRAQIDNSMMENWIPSESPPYDKQHYQLGNYSKLDTTLSRSRSDSKGIIDLFIQPSKFHFA